MVRGTQAGQEAAALLSRRPWEADLELGAPGSETEEVWVQEKRPLLRAEGTAAGGTGLQRGRAGPWLKGGVSFLVEGAMFNSISRAEEEYSAIQIGESKQKPWLVRAEGTFP